MNRNATRCHTGSGFDSILTSAPAGIAVPVVLRIGRVVVYDLDRYRRVPPYRRAPFGCPGDYRSVVRARRREEVPME